jgi:hypothetical protein
MTSRSFLLVACALALCRLSEQESEPVPPRLDIPAGRLYAGQAVEAFLLVEGDSNLPILSIGKGDGIGIIRLGSVEIRPRSASGIGEKTEIKNTYRFPVRLIARKPGTWPLPAIRATVDARTFAVPGRSLTIFAPPSNGRTSAFLGGVGSLRAISEVRPETVSFGEPFEFRLRLEGPGSIGSTEPSSVLGRDRDRATWRVEPLPPESTIDPPSRTFRFRINPDRSGAHSIPPLRISTFDPVTSSYQTTATKAVPIRVIDVPGFDSRQLGPEPWVKSPSSKLVWVVLSGSAGLALAGCLLAYVRFRASRKLRISPRTLAETLISQIQCARGLKETSESVMSSLCEFFGRMADRAPGAMTPEEASELTLSYSGSQEIANQVAQTVRLSDQALYAKERQEESEAELRSLATEVLRQLGTSTIAGMRREASAAAK